MNPLEIRDLTVAYRETAVLWDIDLTIPGGQLCAVVGPNGAGKSTLLKAVLGLIPRLSGQISFFGQPLSRVRQRVGYVPQRSSVDWDFPTDALDVVTMGLYGQLGWFRRPGARQKAQAMECLETVGLADLAHRSIGQLSGGQQQRVFLARALAQNPDLFFMDEPFAGVDAPTEQAILEVLQQLRGQGKTVVVVHHDLETVRDYFDHLTLLNQRILASGPMAQVYTQQNLQATYGQRRTGVRQP